MLLDTPRPVGQPQPSQQLHYSETSSESSPVLGDHADSSYYPPIHQVISPSIATASTIGFKSNADSIRYISRTPSPTPSEAKFLKGGPLIDWKALMNWRSWLRKDRILYYVFAILFIVLFVVVAVYDKDIARFLQPAGNKIRDLPAGFLIPIAIFFVLSFPPLFGHEIVAILVGVVYGLWIGFAITAAGTYVGEVGTFYAFKYVLQKRAQKWEKNRIYYACFARIVRDGGVKVAIVARFSAIPSHFTTAIFSTCGMSFWVFSVAAIVSLPKQFVTVYLGNLLKQEGTGKSDSKDKVVSYPVLAVTAIVTLAAVYYLRKKMDQVKVDVVYGRRKARQLELEQNDSDLSPGPQPHLLQPPVIDPSASGTNFGSTSGSRSNIGPVTPPLQPSQDPITYPQYHAQHQSQQQQMLRIQSPTARRGQAPAPLSTQQYASYGQTSYGQTMPSPHDLPDALPSPQFGPFGQPTNTGSSNPPHSRVGTEDGFADVHTPSNPEVLSRNTLSPPPDYRT